MRSMKMGNEIANSAMLWPRGRRAIARTAGRAMWPFLVAPPRTPPELSQLYLSQSIAYTSDRGGGRVGTNAADNSRQGARSGRQFAFRPADPGEDRLAQLVQGPRYARRRGADVRQLDLEATNALERLAD